MKDDLGLALMGLGAYITYLEKSGSSDDDMNPLKMAYIRLRWLLVKNSTCSPQELLSRAALLHANAKQGLSVSPDWLPCHSAQSLLHSPPCNQQSVGCRCAESLQCELPVVFSLDSPNV